VTEPGSNGRHPRKRESQSSDAVTEELLRLEFIVLGQSAI